MLRKIKNNILKAILTATFTVSVIGCFEVPNYSEVPEIAFNNIDKFTVPDSFSGAKRDSVIITIDYKDGDGDLGEDVSNRTNKKYDVWGNYELKMLRLNDNKVFEEIPQASTNIIFFPILKPDRKKGPIEGKLDYSSYFPYTRSSKLTVVKFRLKVRDRAMNVSNVIETDTISVPLLK
jgi:hypothetical protein